MPQVMAATVTHWKPGDHVLLREAWKGRVWTARPAVVVTDSPELVALYVPAGVHWQRPVGPDDSPIAGSWRTVPGETTHCS